MTLFDAIIPLVVGLLLVARPQAFFKPIGSPDEIAKKSARFRRIGYVLIGVAVLYSMIALIGA